VLSVKSSVSEPEVGYSDFCKFLPQDRPRPLQDMSPFNSSFTAILSFGAYKDLKTIIVLLTATDYIWDQDGGSNMRVDKLA
jgi:hypothetical protein